MSKRKREEEDEDPNPFVKKGREDNRAPKKRGREEEEDPNPSVKKKHEDFSMDMMDNDIQHWIQFAKDPESFDPLDLEELFEIRSTSLDPRGIWDPSILIDGSRRSGKSVLAKHICIEAHKRGLIGRISVITGTKQNTFWEDLAPYSTIFPVKNAREALQLLVQFQEYTVEEFKDGEDIEFDLIQHTIILDDFIGDQQFAKYSSELVSAFTNFRHTGCCVIAITQYPTGVPPAVRTNSDFAFVFLQQSDSQTERVMKDHFSFIHDKKVAYFLLNNVPREFRCIAVHKTDPYLKPNEKVKWFKATDWDKEAGGHSTLQVGHPEWREKVSAIDEKQKAKRRRERKMMGTPNMMYNPSSGTDPNMEAIKSLKNLISETYEISF